MRCFFNFVLGLAIGVAMGIEMVRPCALTVPEALFPSARPSDWQPLPDYATHDNGVEIDYGAWGELADALEAGAMGATEPPAEADAASN